MSLVQPRSNPALAAAAVVLESKTGKTMLIQFARTSGDKAVRASDEVLRACNSLVGAALALRGQTQVCLLSSSVAQKQWLPSWQSRICKRVQETKGRKAQVQGH